MYSSVNGYLMGSLPNMVSTGGYTPSNQTMSFAPNQPKSFFSSNPTQFDGSMNLVGDNKTFNWNPETGGGGSNFSDKLGLGIGALNSIISGINGHRSYQLGKKQLTAQTDQFNQQFAAQRGLINSQLADRQDWRNRNQPGKFMSTAEYMDKYGVK